MNRHNAPPTVTATSGGPSPRIRPHVQTEQERVNVEFAQRLSEVEKENTMLKRRLEELSVVRVSSSGRMRGTPEYDTRLHVNHFAIYIKKNGFTYLVISNRPTTGKLTKTVVKHGI